MSARMPFFVLLLLLSIPVSEPLYAQVPDSISVQGVLTDPSGTLLDTTLSVTFELYKGGVSVWSENQSGLVVSNGLFNAILGEGGSLDTVAFDGPMELGITMKLEPELTPRIPLVPVPYALGARGMSAVWAEDLLNEGFNVVIGAPNNVIDPGVVGGTIGGGGGVFNGGQFGNTITGDLGTIGGGARNIVGEEGTVCGGENNSARGNGSTIAGGINNTISSLGIWSAIGGGTENDVVNSLSTIGGGFANDAQGSRSTVSGGEGNTASGNYSTVPGGKNNESTQGYTFAAGFKAKANHSGTFVWADSASSSGVDFASTDENQFLIRAGGGVGIGTNSPDAPLDIAGGNNWNLTTTDGDLKIGNDTYRLEVGVSLDGGGAGNSRINAVGGTSRLMLGGGETDVVAIDVSNGLYPWSNNTYSLGSSTNKWTEVWATNGTIQVSDARLKTAVQNSPYGLGTVMQLRPVVYQWADRADERKIGLIAQEVEDVVPEVVQAPADDTEYYGMNYAELVPILISAIQEQQAIIDNQQSALQNQSHRITALEARIRP